MSALDLTPPITALELHWAFHRIREGGFASPLSCSDGSEVELILQWVQSRRWREQLAKDGCKDAKQLLPATLKNGRPAR